MAETPSQNLTPEESATLTRAAHAVSAGLYLQPSETETLVKLCERLSSAVGVAERDSQDARGELARFTQPLDQLSPGVTAELRRGWRFSAEAARALIQQGKADLDPLPMLECFIYSLDALDRLSLELQKRDQFLQDVETRTTSLTLQVRELFAQRGLPDPFADNPAFAPLRSESAEPLTPPIDNATIDPAFNADDTPPDFRSPAPAGDGVTDDTAATIDRSELSELDTRAASPGAGLL